MPGKSYANIGAHRLTHLRAARGREHPHPPRGGRRVREAGDALLDRQGLVGAGAPGAEGVRTRRRCRSRSCTSTRRGSSATMIRVPRRFCARERARPPRPHQPATASREDINPFDHGSQKYTTVMKTQALLQALTQARLRRGVRRRAPRRGEVARQGAHLLVPRSLPAVGPEEPAARAVEPLQRQGATRARASASSRSRTGPSSTSGSTSTSRTSRSCRSTSPRRARWSSATAR